MRVTSVSILSEEVEAIRFDLRSTTAKSQYIISNIAGLDADEIIPKFYGFSKDGTKRFYDFKLRQRELVLRIVMNPNYRLGETNSDIRDNVYVGSGFPFRWIHSCKNLRPHHQVRSCIFLE
jgi:hypothetical protein